jgi:branched-subunit amino acid aminotransferase/4-amino-4-deoxychorismate lyase
VTLDPQDPSLWGGLGLFESFTVRTGRPLAADRHLARLQRGAACLGLPWTSKWEAELSDFLSLLSGDHALRLLLTAGGRRILRATAWSPTPSAALWQHSALPTGLPPSLKHTLRGAWTWTEAQRGGELLFVENGCWTETSRANLWAVRDGCLRTPPLDGILPGVTRSLLLEAAADAGLEVRVEPLPVGPVDELYISSSLRDLCPVTRLDGMPIAGQGPVGERLQSAFRERIASSQES